MAALRTAEKQVRLLVGSLVVTRTQHHVVWGHTWLTAGEQSSNLTTHTGKYRKKQQQQQQPSHAEEHLCTQGAHKVFNT